MPIFRDFRCFDDTDAASPSRASSAGEDGEFLKGISKQNWDSVKRQYAAKTLPKSHPVSALRTGVGAGVVCPLRSTVQSGGPKGIA